MGEITPIDWPGLDDDTMYNCEVEVYGYPDGEDCLGSYIENAECQRTGGQIKYWTNSGQECVCEEGLCPSEYLCASQRLVNVSGI